jgi:hypothetical protein
MCTFVQQLFWTVSLGDKIDVLCSTQTEVSLMFDMERNSWAVLSVTNGLSAQPTCSLFEKQEAYSVGLDIAINNTYQESAREILSSTVQLIGPKYFEIVDVTCSVTSIGVIFRACLGCFVTCGANRESHAGGEAMASVDAFSDAGYEFMRSIPWTSASWCAIEASEGVGSELLQHECVIHGLEELTTYNITCISTDYSVHNNSFSFDVGRKIATTTGTPHISVSMQPFGNLLKLEILSFALGTCTVLIQTYRTVDKYCWNTERDGDIFIGGSLLSLRRQNATLFPHGSFSILVEPTPHEPMCLVLALRPSCELPTEIRAPFGIPLHNSALGSLLDAVRGVPLDFNFSGIVISHAMEFAIRRVWMDTVTFDVVVTLEGIDLRTHFGGFRLNCSKIVDARCTDAFVISGFSVLLRLNPEQPLPRSLLLNRTLSFNRNHRSWANHPGDEESIKYEAVVKVSGNFKFAPLTLSMDPDMPSCAGELVVVISSVPLLRTPEPCARVSIAFRDPNGVFINDSLHEMVYGPSREARCGETAYLRIRNAPVGARSMFLGISNIYGVVASTVVMMPTERPVRCAFVLKPTSLTAILPKDRVVIEVSPDSPDLSAFTVAEGVKWTWYSTWIGTSDSSRDFVLLKPNITVGPDAIRLVFPEFSFSSRRLYCIIGFADELATGLRSRLVTSVYVTSGVSVAQIASIKIEALAAGGRQLLSGGASYSENCIGGPMNAGRSRWKWSCEPLSTLLSLPICNRFHNTSLTAYGDTEIDLSGSDSGNMFIITAEFTCGMCEEFVETQYVVVTAMDSVSAELRESGADFEEEGSVAIGEVWERLKGSMTGVSDQARMLRVHLEDTIPKVVKLSHLNSYINWTSDVSTVSNTSIAVRWIPSFFGVLKQFRPLERCLQIVATIEPWCTFRYCTYVIGAATATGLLLVVWRVKRGGGARDTSPSAGKGPPVKSPRRKKKHKAKRAGEETQASLSVPFEPAKVSPSPQPLSHAYPIPQHPGTSSWDRLEDLLRSASSPYRPPAPPSAGSAPGAITRSFSSGDLFDRGDAGIARIDSMSLDPLDLALRTPALYSGPRHRAISSSGLILGAAGKETIVSGSTEMDRMEAATGGKLPLSPRWRFAGKPRGDSVLLTNQSTVTENVGDDTVGGDVNWQLRG